MNIPKLSGLEHSCVLVAAVSATLLIAPAVVPTWVKVVALVGGLGIAVASFVIRGGGKPSIS